MSLLSSGAAVTRLAFGAAAATAAAAGSAAGPAALPPAVVWLLSTISGDLHVDITAGQPEDELVHRPWMLLRDNTAALSFLLHRRYVKGQCGCRAGHCTLSP
jgi:hypothetical protein